MASIDDSTQTPPGYWFGVIEGRLHQRMREALADLGLRRGSWRILHTLADGPATADELAAKLPRDDRKPGRIPFGEFGGGRGRAHGYGRHPGWRSQEPRDEHAFAGHGWHGSPGDGDDHRGNSGREHRGERDDRVNGDNGHHEHHGDHTHHHAHAFERGYERGFDRGFALGALRGPQAHSPWMGAPWAAGHPGAPWAAGFGQPDHGPHGFGHGQHPDAPFAAHHRSHRDGRRGHRIQRVLADFVERGWVWFDGDRATLTEEGRAAHDAAFEQVGAVRAELVNGIPEADYATTMATLEAMARNLGWRPAGDERLPEDGQAGEPSMDA
jgi:hypothetical protein